MTPAQIKRLLPRRSLDCHKGDFGHALILAGSRGMSGAAVLSAQAALKVGAGLVTAAVPASIQNVVASAVPEALTLGLPETESGSFAAAAEPRVRQTHEKKRFSTLAMGPGISTGVETVRAVMSLLSLSLPALLDADALNSVSAQPRVWLQETLKRRGAPCILTPHPGEMARLMGVEGVHVQRTRRASAESLARDLGCVCVLKGHGTIVTDGRRTHVNATGNPGLAKGGSGDVLTGIIVGLWAQNRAPQEAFEIACLGVHLHGLAADIAVREKTTYALLASDIIEALPKAFKALGVR